MRSVLVTGIWEWRDVMKAIEMKKGIYWVGAIDWDLRNFHGYLTQRGSTYNAYLIIDEKVTLIDTVKQYKKDEMLQRIRSVIDPSKIDYVISNHVEMDHSGALPAVMDIVPEATLVTSPNGEKGLKRHYKKDWNFKVIQSGETLNIGKNNLQFVLTPMVHWPDNMLTYLPEEKILFSNDAFGQHLATNERFDDEYPVDVVFQEAEKYYANIVLPYGNQVNKALEAAAGLDIGMIAPSHGIIWRKHISEIFSRYKKWAANETEKKAVIIYDTMWGSTLQMAETVMDCFDEAGYRTKLCNLQHHHISDVITDIIDAEYICIGSPTLNNNILPTVASFMCYLKGLAPKGRKAIAFGSYGWGGQSVGILSGMLEEMKMEVAESHRIQYIPEDSDLDELREKIRAVIG